MNVKIVNKSRHKLPEYSTEKSAGMDSRASIDNNITLMPLKRALINTGKH